jgi:hypothetical protein
MVELHTPRSYLATIENSVGSGIFRTLYFTVDDGRTLDVLEDGDLACASFVSSILYLFDLIGERHTTVKATVADMQEQGWYALSEPRVGAVIHWGFKKKDDGTQGKHHHLGFYIDASTAVSNSSDTRVIASHHPTYGTFENGEPRRDILAYYWHEKLGA